MLSDVDRADDGGHAVRPGPQRAEGAPLSQLAMVPMLVLIARTARPGSEATTFAVMASLVNLALSASELFTRYLNTAFGITQQDYGDLGLLMTTVTVRGARRGLNRGASLGHLEAIRSDHP